MAEGGLSTVPDWYPALQKFSDLSNKAYRAFDYGEWEARQFTSVELHYKEQPKPEDNVVNNEKPDQPQGPIQHEDYEPNGPDGKAHTGVGTNENGDDEASGKSGDPVHLKPVNFNMADGLLMAQVPSYTSTNPYKQPSGASKMNPRNKDTSDGGGNSPITNDDGKLSTPLRFFIIVFGLLFIGFGLSMLLTGGSLYFKENAALLVLVLVLYSLTWALSILIGNFWIALSIAIFFALGFGALVYFTAEALGLPILAGISFYYIGFVTLALMSQDHNKVRDALQIVVVLTIFFILGFLIGFSVDNQFGDKSTYFGRLVFTAFLGSYVFIKGIYLIFLYDTLPDEYQFATGDGMETYVDLQTGGDDTNIQKGMLPFYMFLTVVLVSSVASFFLQMIFFTEKQK